jgi:hypothetical protein
VTVLRRLACALPALALLACAACGTQHTARQTVRQPRLPARLASQLAGQSTSVAAMLDAGDGCGALQLARRLQQQTIDAINSGRVPGAFEEPLQASVNEIVARIRCVPVPPATTTTEHRKKGKGHHKHEHGEGGKGD